MGERALSGEVVAAIYPEAAVRRPAPPHDRAKVAAASRRDNLGHRVRERPQDDVERLHSCPAVEKDRRRRARVIHRPRFRPDLDRAQVAFVDQLVAAAHRQNRKASDGSSCRQWAIDRPALLRRRVREIDDDVAAVDLHRDFKWDEILRDTV